MARYRPPTAAQGGFTLIELMAVMAILAIVAAIAVPAISRYSNEAEFTGQTKRLAQDLQLARYHSTSRPEDGVMVIEEHKANQLDRYSIQTVMPGDTTMALLKQVSLPSYVEIFGVIQKAALPGITYSPPSTQGEGLPTEIRFSGTGNVLTMISGTTDPGDPTTFDALKDSSVTIFLQSADKEHLHKARIVVYTTTGYTRIFDEW